MLENSSMTDADVIGKQQKYYDKTAYHNFVGNSFITQIRIDPAMLTERLIKGDILVSGDIKDDASLGKIPKIIAALNEAVKPAIVKEEHNDRRLLIRVSPEDGIVLVKNVLGALRTAEAITALEVDVATTALGLPIRYISGTSASKSEEVDR